MNKTILFSADWHLMERRYDKTWLGEDFFEAAMNLCRLAVKMGIDTIINPGDLLDTRKPHTKVIQQLMKLQEYCQENKLRIYTTIGNHDLIEPSWPQLLNSPTGDVDLKAYGFIGLNKDLITLEHEGRFDGPTVYGVPYLPSDELRTLFGEMREGGIKPDILMLHTAIKEFAGFPVSHYISIVEMDGLAGSILVGDQHVHKALRTPDDTWVGYPGTLEMTEFGEDVDKRVWKMDYMQANDKWVLMSADSVSTTHRPVIDEVISQDGQFEVVLQRIRDAIASGDKTPIVRVELRIDVPNAKSRLREVGANVPDFYFQANNINARWQEAAAAESFSVTSSLRHDTMHRMLAQAEPATTNAFRITEKIVSNPTTVKEVLEDEIRKVYAD